MVSEKNEQGWFCLFTRTRQENKVAQILQRELAIGVFSPRIRFRRMRYQQPLWVTEALFPGYVFAEFSFPEMHRQIRAVPGVAGIVTFGDQPALLPQTLIAELRARVDDRETVQIDATPEPGSEIIISSGSLAGLRALVTRVLPARQRIAILLELLGQEREVEIEADRVLLSHPRQHA